MRSVLILTLLLFPSFSLAFTIPPNDGFVTDAVGILNAQEETTLEESIRMYRDETSNEIAILIVGSLEGESIADRAVEIGREWGVGGAENDNGIFILVAYEDRQIFLATGYGLEGAVPDIVAKGIIDGEITPSFRDGQYFAGLSAGIESLKKHIGGEYTADRYSSNGKGGLPWEFLLFLAFIIFEALAVFLGKSKSWWMGGVIGLVVGIAFVIFNGWWISIPILTIFGLILDFLLSKFKYGSKRGKRGRRGVWYGGGRGGGGGFGGFGGGSFGGGGGGGSW